MKVLIVAKTRRGAGAYVGGLTEGGRSVRLVAPDEARNQPAGLEYDVGEVWEIESVPDPDIVPPHVENIIVVGARRIRRSQKVTATIHRFMPPVRGGTEKLFEGLLQATPTGGLYISQQGGLPQRSTMFWIPDRPLLVDCEGKRIRYRYPTRDGGRTLTFVGFQEPLTEIPVGTLLRVSLAHWWCPQDRPDGELRCFAQLSGWFPGPEAEARRPQRRLVTKPRLASQSSPGQAASVSQETLRKRAAEVLKRTFGFSEFLPLQADIVSRVLQGRDVLAVMPTGGGKSLCYQLPALLLEGVTVVASPLVALMHDQISQLKQVGVPAACLNHLVPLRDYEQIMRAVRRGGLRLLYLAPETLLRPEIQLLLDQSRLACLAIDEAHCISEWGYDFRPEYRQLASVRRRFPDAVCLALTATATSRVREDIRHHLDIPAEGEFVASFNRRNLFLAVQTRRDGLAQLLAFLEQRRGQSGIIYCGTRKQADGLCGDLIANGWPALTYHAGMPGDERRRNQESFIHDEAPLMVATVAFGMGINKSNVRFVVHAHLPKDLESYYQEIGRAGRDGLPADCLLLYSRGDAVIHRRFIEAGAASQREGREARLRALMTFAEARGCRRKPLMAYFDEALQDPCGCCDNCAQTMAEGPVTDVTDAARKFLSCVKATDQVFGAAHVVAVLRGSRAEKVRTRGHDRLSVFGTGREVSTEEWSRLVERFVQFGLLERELDYGTLRLTSKAWNVLNGKEKVLVPAEGKATTILATSPVQGADAELFQKLRDLRKTLATRAGVPAYVIFSDRALLEMAKSLPQDRTQFLAINGVGKVKLDAYSDAFLQIIRAHCAQHGPVPAPKMEATPPHPPIRSDRGGRTREIGELFAGGQTIAQIAARYGILPGTVTQHLHRFKQLGGKVDASRVLGASRLPDLERRQVLAAFERLGAERLAPVHAALSGAVPYAALHLLRLYWLCQKAS